MPFTACAPVPVTVGTNRVVEPVSDAFDVQDVVLTRRAGPLAGGPLAGGTQGSVAPPPVRVLSWTAGRRMLQLYAPVRSYLVVDENFNAGWRATVAGSPLHAVRLDGWKQAWLLPAGTVGLVTLTYAPGPLYHDALLGGLATLALVVLLALWPGLPHRRRSGPPAAPGRQKRSPARRPWWLRWWPGWPARWRAAWPVAGAALTTAAVLAGLLLAGFWLGGFPGAVIVLAATGLFTAAFSYRHAHRIWLELCRPWLLAALILAATISGVAGEQILATSGTTSPLVTTLSNTAPQIICLVAVARLAAALLVGDP
jgi:arabinofuranan 3-O-arabinosyltransferase